MSATHVLTIAHFPGFADESRLVLRCTAAPEAICRRRPVDGDLESWDSNTETTPGHECWAVEYASDGGMETLAYRGSRAKGEFDYAGPVDVWFDGDGVAWCEHVEAEPMFEVQP